MQRRELSPVDRRSVYARYRQCVGQGGLVQSPSLGIHLVLCDMQNRTSGPYLAAICRIIVPVIVALTFMLMQGFMYIYVLDLSTVSLAA
jgi:hypothetical protein